MSLRESWSGRVAVHFELDTNEVAAASASPPPLVRLLPRHAYLPSVAGAALSLHRDLLPPGEDTTWFSCDGVPLKWQIPVGVLYDLVVAGREMPWMLQVHHRFFPSGVLLPMADPAAGALAAGPDAGEDGARAGAGGGREDPARAGRAPEASHGAAARALRRQWLSSLKEAMFVLNGARARPVARSPPAAERRASSCAARPAHSRLWNAPGPPPRSAGSAGATSVMEMEEEHADAMFAAIEAGNWERFSIAMSATSIDAGGAGGRAQAAQLQERVSDQLPVRICMIEMPAAGSSGADAGDGPAAGRPGAQSDLRDWATVRAPHAPRHTGGAHGRPRGRGCDRTLTVGNRAPVPPRPDPACRSSSSTPAARPASSRRGPTTGRRTRPRRPG